MNKLDITAFPIIDPSDDKALFEIGIPDCMVDLAKCATTGVRAIYAELKGKQDPQPTVFLAGWDMTQPRMDILGIDGRWLQDGTTKQGLAASLRDNIFARRMDQKTETFGVGFLSAIWAAGADESDVAKVRVQGIGNEPIRIECCFIELIWQDGHASLIAPVTRSLIDPGNGKVELGEWRVMLDGRSSTASADSRWNKALAPALCATAYADAMLASLAISGEGEAQ